MQKLEIFLKMQKSTYDYFFFNILNFYRIYRIKICILTIFEKIWTWVANFPSFGKKMPFLAYMLLLPHVTSDQPNFWSVYSLITG